MLKRYQELELILKEQFASERELNAGLIANFFESLYNSSFK